MQSFSGYWVSHTNRYNVTFQGNVHKEVAIVPKQLRVGGLRTETCVLPNSPRASNALVKARVLRSHSNRTLHLWFFSMRDFRWPSLTKRYNQLVLTAFIKIFNFSLSFLQSPHHCLRKWCLKQKNKLKKNPQRQAEVKGRSHTNKNKSKTGIGSGYGIKDVPHTPLASDADPRRKGSPIPLPFPRHYTGQDF